MKGIKLSLVVLTVFSLFLIVYFNSNSLAKEGSELFVDSRIIDEINENGQATVIVELKDASKNGKSKNNIDNFLTQMNKLDDGFDLVYRYDSFNSLAIEVDSKGIEALKQNTLVKSINFDDVLYTQLQQSLPLVNATYAWTVAAPSGGSVTGAGQTVCVIDTGVDYTNPALGGTFGTKVIGGYDFVNNDTDPRDDNGHGTHVAGIVAANGVINGTLVRGVAPDAKIIAVKSCAFDGSCQTSRVLAGINYCLTTVHPGKLSSISMSLGNGLNHNAANCPTTYNAAINSAVGSGVPVVVASGNQGYKTGISSPACVPGATSVGMTYDDNNGAVGFTSVCVDMTTWADKVSCATNSGPNLDLMAPGARIISTTSSIGTACGAGNGQMTATCSGTSMAAPHVAGAIALMKQYHLRGKDYSSQGSLLVQKIEYLLKNNGVSVVDSGNNLTFPRLSLGYLI